MSVCLQGDKGYLTKIIWNYIFLLKIDKAHLITDQSQSHTNIFLLYMLYNNTESYKIYFVHSGLINKISLKISVAINNYKIEKYIFTKIANVFWKSAQY